MRVMPSPQLAAGTVLPQRARRASAQSGQGEAAFICLKSASLAFSSWAPLGRIRKASFLLDGFSAKEKPSPEERERVFNFSPRWGAEQNDYRVDLAKDAMENQQSLFCPFSSVFWDSPRLLAPPAPASRPSRDGRSPAAHGGGWVMLRGGRRSPVCSSAPG